MGHTKVHVPQPRHDSDSSFHSGASKNSDVFPSPNASAEREESGSFASLSFISSFCAFTALSSHSSVKLFKLSRSVCPFSVFASRNSSPSVLWQTISPSGSDASMPKVEQKQLSIGFVQAIETIIPCSLRFF